MASKRKQEHTLKSNESANIQWENELEALRTTATEAKRGKQENTKQKQASCVLLTTQLVEKSKRNDDLVPAPHMKEKDYVTLMGAFNFENVYSCIKNHYKKKIDVDDSNTIMVLLATNTGPRIINDTYLGAKKNFQVYFEKKQASIAPTPSISYTYLATFNPQMRTPSVFPIEPSRPQQPTLPAIATTTRNRLPQGYRRSGTSSHLDLRKSVQPTLDRKSTGHVYYGHFKRRILSTSNYQLTFVLTLDDLMALGKKVPEVILINGRMRALSFEPTFRSFVWSPWKDITIKKTTCLGAGGFREAYKCEVGGAIELTDEFYVVKTFHKKAVESRMKHLASLNNVYTEMQTMEELNKKAVQTLLLAQILADKFRHKFRVEHMPLPRYVSSWLIEFSTGGYGTLEEFIPGNFTKYLNNSMDQYDYPPTSDLAMKAVAFAHYTYEFGNGAMMITDLQGVGMVLSDPEVATKKRFELKEEKGEMVFGAGNFPQALDIFAHTHQCNRVCREAKLNALARLISK